MEVRSYIIQTVSSAAPEIGLPVLGLICLPRTCNIEEAAEIDPAWFEGAESVGICGATSTPKWLMQEVADRIEKIGKGK